MDKITQIFVYLRNFEFSENESSDLLLLVQNYQQILQQLPVN